MSYTSLAKVFHWVVAFAVLCTIPLGLAMLRVEGQLQNQLFDLHRSFGALVLVLAALRLLWRLFHKPPPLPDSVPAWQKTASQMVHWGLYVLLFAVPLLGWAGTSAYRAPITVFGLFRLPPIVAENRALSEKLLGWHVAFVIVMAALLALHIGAALYHHFVQKDGVLLRMLPRLRGHRENVPMSDR